jgi:F-type H+-transporting ATPase subunit a
MRRCLVALSHKARILGLLGLAALAFPSAAFARGEFDPSEEWNLHDWVPIHLGPIDLSINKAVAYLWLGALVSIALGLGLMRIKIGSKTSRRQAFGETIYEIAQVQIAEQGIPHKAIRLWFPYVASLLIFIWSVNIIGFIPLPLSDEKFHLFGVALPTFAIFAATSTLSVTLALALMTWVFTHIEGIRWNGAVMRLISLSVRLYANMLAGHVLILTFIGLIFVLESVILAVFSVPLAVVFYLFEVVIVVSIQAFIFAALSAIYIGSAIEPEH